MYAVPRLSAVALLTLCAGGCARPWRPPPPPPVSQAPASRPASLRVSDYLAANRVGRWVYERHELPEHSDRPVVRYARKVTPWRTAEGRLETRSFLPVAAYIRDGDVPASQPSAPIAASAPLRDGIGLLFELAEPTPPIPEDLEGSDPRVSRTDIVYYDRLGRRRDRGELTRTVQIEGTESVDCPAGRFEDCLRVRIDLRMEFPWGPTLDWTSYLWLSRDVGEVRRVQTMTGWLWIINFGSTYEYQLLSHEPDPQATPGSQAPAWTRGALLLGRGIPRPEIAGMIVEFEDGAPDGTLR